MKLTNNTYLIYEAGYFKTYKEKLVLEGKLKGEYKKVDWQYYHGESSLLLHTDETIIEEVKAVCRVLLKAYQISESKEWFKARAKAEEDKIKRELKKEESEL